MLFELVTMLPDALTATSRSPLQPAAQPCSEQPEQAASRPINQQMQPQDRVTQQWHRPSKREHSHRAINVGQESALLQVGSCQTEYIPEKCRHWEPAGHDRPDLFCMGC